MARQNELHVILLAIIIMTLVFGFTPISEANYEGLAKIFIFSVVVIGTNVAAKKAIARSLDASATHEIWHFQRYGFIESLKFKKPVPMGIILPLFFTLFSLGSFKVLTFLTYETNALKRRAARRHGHFSFTEMTDWHIALIGASGIIATLLISFIAYWIPGLEGLSSIAAFYAFFNLIPISKLDGTQIYFGSRTLWTALALITLIITAFSLLII